MKKLVQLEKMRKKQGITIVELAKRLGKTSQYIWDIEDGRRNLSYKMAFEIALILDVKPDDLFLEDFKKSSK